MFEDDDDQELLAELREGFEMADLNGDGKIQLNEFIAFAGDLMEGASVEELTIGFREADRDGSGGIDFDEFVTWWREIGPGS